MNANYLACSIYNLVIKPGRSEVLMLKHCVDDRWRFLQFLDHHELN